MRPEIKIPPNPMAALRKVPAPKPKEVDWSEEFRKERSRSKSPMPPSLIETTTNNNDNQSSELPEPVRELNVQQSSPTNAAAASPSPIQSFGSQQQTQNKESENNSSYRDQNNNFSNNNNYGGSFNQNQYTPPQQYQQQQQQYQPIQQQQSVQPSTVHQQQSPQQRVFSPFASSPQPNLPKPMSPIKLNHTKQDTIQEENVPIYVRSSQRAASEKPASPQIHPQAHTAPNSSFQRQASLEHGSTPIYTRSPRNVTASPVKQFNQTSTFQPNTNDNENYPIYVRSFQRQQPSPAPTPASSAAPVAPTPQQPLSTTQSSFINDPGRQYYNPNSATTQNGSSQNGAQMPPWMRRTNSKEIPEWANNVNDYSRAAPTNNTSTFGVDYNRSTSTPSQVNNSNSTFGNTSNYPNQYNNANHSTTQYNNNNSANYNGGAPMVKIPVFFCKSVFRFNQTCFLSLILCRNVISQYSLTDHR